MLKIGKYEFAVRRENAGLFSIWRGDKCAGLFVIDPTGALTIRGRYVDIAESDEELVAIAEEYLHSTQAMDDGLIPHEAVSRVRLRSHAQARRAG